MMTDAQVVARVCVASIVPRRSSLAWAPSHARRSMAHRCGASVARSDKLACEAWTKRMLGFRGPAQPSPTLGDAINAGYPRTSDLILRKA